MFQILQSGVELMQRRKRNLFFSVCPLTALLILLSASPLQAAQEKRLVPVGQTVGVTMDTKGLLVLGIGSVDAEENPTPSQGILQAGDLILRADGQEVENKEVLQHIVEQSAGEPITLLLERDGAEREVEIRPAGTTDGGCQIGVWVRDSIQGIGTVTWYDPQEKTFAALGHGIYDVDTGELMQIREGTLTQTTVTDIVKGKKGSPGELCGRVEREKSLAMIEQNTETGIYGRNAAFSGEALPVAAAAEVKKGEAQLLSDLEGGEVQAYSLEITHIHHSRNHKDMTIRITDERLLALTGGIVQGMSGSPIVQNGKLVGAVTYVLVNQPDTGYGIFIENMLDTAG